MTSALAEFSLGRPTDLDDLVVFDRYDLLSPGLLISDQKGGRHETAIQ